MKKQLIIGLSLLFCTYLQAQDNDQYFYINAGGGFHNLSYKLQNGTEKGGFGTSVNAGYSYFLNEHWGLQTGIGLKSVRPEATLNFMTGNPSTDTDGEDYEFRTYYNNWKEKENLLFLDIPLGLNYRQELSEKFHLLATAGLKIFVPLKTTYKTTGGEIVTSGYYSQYNVELKDLPRHGFNTITGQLTGDVSIKPSYSGFAELGALYSLSPGFDLYVGGYVDYGLNNVAKNSDKFVYQQDGVYNGVLASNELDEARTVFLGLKVGLQWHFRKRKVFEEIASPVMVQVEPPVAENVVAVEIEPQKPEPSKEEIIEQAVVVEQIPQATEITTQPKAEDISKVDVKKKDNPYTRARTLAASIKIYFKFNSNEPLNSEDADILTLSKIIKANRGMSLHIIGNTDDLGTKKVNKKIGLQRANMVRQKFLKNGVSSSQLHSEAKVLDTITNRSQNRVVTLVVK